MSNSALTRARRLVSRTRKVRLGVRPGSRELEEVRRRLEELEVEMQEARRLNRRLAELTDVVEELLVPLADRDEEKLRQRLERYSASL